MKKSNDIIEIGATIEPDGDGIQRLQRLQRREIFIFDEIDSGSMQNAIEDILYLLSLDKVKPITIYLNSLGGNVGDGFALTDIILNCSCPVRIIGLGEVASMASLIFVVGTKGQRFMGKHGWIMFHPISLDMPIDSVKSQKVRVTQAEQLEKQYDALIEQRTSIPKEIYSKAKDDELWIPAAKAIEYKIVDDYYKGQ